MRPKSLDEYIGQRHLVGSGAPLRVMMEHGDIPSVILWGPPGVGKTTLAEIISSTIDVPYYTLSAINSGVADIRRIIDEIKDSQGGLFSPVKRPVLFIDEIHRFSKSQQDSLLAAVERGLLTLIGATTENPSFEVIRPLLSRCQTYILQPLSDEEILELAYFAARKDEELRAKQCEFRETEALIQYAGGDARKLLNILDLMAATEVNDSLVITNEKVRERIQESPTAFDKGGELHYDIASAFIKSIRGSDPDAALYWLARLISGGEDPRFIARRLVISASEDIGLANPNALLIANAAADAVNFVGWPEGRIPLAEATIYLATSEKSNSAYRAIDCAVEFVGKTGNLPVPLHLRNAATSFMKDIGYGQGYKYAHDYSGHYVPQQYLPDAAVGLTFWKPSLDNTSELRAAERQAQRVALASD